MQLVFLLLLVVGPFFLLTGGWVPAAKLDRITRARVGLSLFFAFAALGHFIWTEEMSRMLPPSFSFRVELIYITGVLELLGAIGVWIPSLTRLTGICLILLLVGVLPANIYSAISYVDFGGHASGPVYLLLRVPFQLFLIWWTYWATEQNWFSARARAA